MLERCSLEIVSAVFRMSADWSADSVLVLAGLPRRTESISAEASVVSVLVVAEFLYGVSTFLVAMTELIVMSLPFFMAESRTSSKDFPSV